MCPGELQGFCPSGSQAMPCSIPGRRETQAGQRPQCCTNDSSPEDPGTWHRGTLGLVPATFLPPSSVGPALPGHRPLSAGSHRAQRPLQVLTKQGEHSASQLLPMPVSVSHSPVSLLHGLEKCAH